MGVVQLLGAVTRILFQHSAKCSIAKGMTLRSTLFVPADHARAMAKVNQLAVDAVIVDLEDGVSEAHKQMARDALMRHAEKIQPRFVVRMNHMSTPHYERDAEIVAKLPVDAVMLSKVADANEVANAVAHFALLGRADIAIWCNLETPQGFMDVRSISAHPSVQVLVAGTNDLANDLRIVRTPCRSGLMYCLGQLVLAARAAGKSVLDGTFIDLNDQMGLIAEAVQGRMLGFDGKTLIHPSQIDAVNEVFSPSGQEREMAQRIVHTYESALAEGKAVTLLDGSMIERLHYNRARELLKTN